SYYVSRQQRLAVTHEGAPFGRSSSGFLKRLHATAFLGGFTASHDIEITDGVVTIDDSSQNPGLWAGVDLNYPVLFFWLSVRLELTYQEIELEALDFKTNSLQRGALFGGSYAF